jgi:cytochrome c553
MKKLLIIGLSIALAGAWSARADDAKTIFDTKCAKCHGDDGKGQKTMGKKLGCKDWTDAAVQAKFTDDDATKAIKEGFKDSDGKTLMKAAEGLSDDDVKGLVAYVRAFKK